VRLVIGSRGSALALWQANHVADHLRQRGHTTEIVVIKTTGDKIQDVSLSQAGKQTGTKGLFTKEIEEALLAREIDLAVHSLKDMPTELPEGLTLRAIPPRADVRDALIGGRLQQLPPAAKIGTSSLRRMCQLKALRPDLNVLTIRGNVDTRLRKQAEGEFDAIVLASAGLTRLGWADRIDDYLDTDVMIPAVGQGALAIETRDENDALNQAVRELNDEATERCVVAERALLRGLGGGCQVPLGAFAITEGKELLLKAAIFAPDGSTCIRTNGRGIDARTLGSQLAEDLLSKGGEQLLRSVYGDQ
jgi:hydroxymethylbilane synthase